MSSNKHCILTRLLRKYSINKASGRSLSTIANYISIHKQDIKPSMLLCFLLSKDVLFSELVHIFQWSKEEQTEASMYEQGEGGKIEMSLMHFHVSLVVLCLL